MVVQLPGEKFVKGNQWKETATGKQYITWYEVVPYSTFNPDKMKGYAYVPEFNVISVIPEAVFEDRPVTQTAERQSEEESGGWGNEQGAEPVQAAHVEQGRVGLGGWLVPMGPGPSTMEQPQVSVEQVVHSASIWIPAEQVAGSVSDWTLAMLVGD
jgi:hypothetical protein